MFILPISHEQNTSRRWPVVTTTIVALCVVIHLWMTLTGGVERGVDRIASSGNDVVTYLLDHPYLQAPPKLERWLDEELPVEQKHAFVVAHAAPPPIDADPPAEQAELQRRFRVFEQAISDAPLYKYGFVPRLNNWVGLFTSMFFHAGWLHLIGNLWLLWLCGCNLEDRWGRPVFSLMYLVAGVVAGLAHKAAFPIAFAPLVGASGAIAGAMGGFLVVFAQTRVRFLYVMAFSFRVRVGTFMARAYWMLLLWVGWEILSALWLTQSGVAHWAHVGGFGCGVVVALLLRFTGAEAKLDEAVENRVAVTQDPRVREALDLIDAGNSHLAIPKLDRLLRAEPDHPDALLALLRAANDMCDAAALARAYNGLIERHLRNGEIEAARTLFDEPKLAGVNERISPKIVLRLAEIALERNEPLRAAELAARLYSGARDSRSPDSAPSLSPQDLMNDMAIRGAVCHGAALARLGRLDEARSLLGAVTESPATPLDAHKRAQTELDAIAKRRPDAVDLPLTP